MNIVVVIKTSKGTMEAELYADKAPLSVDNFLKYVDEKAYDGTIFHRVIKDFMIQGGGFTAVFDRKRTHEPITNEATNGLKNLRGTLAMARTNEVNSATNQFFINHKDNSFLDHKGTDLAKFGYCVFGKLTTGLDVLDKIATVKTGTSHGMQDVPAEAVTIESIRRK